jgi:hypothetical protein
LHAIQSSALPRTGLLEQPTNDQTTKPQEKENAMLIQPKVRQASLIIFATALLLILPNLTRLLY